eukprot:g637.t1
MRPTKETNTSAEFIRRDAKAFARENKQLRLEVQTFPGKHPTCIGQYVNENEKVIDVKNKSATDIMDQVHFLRNQSGRRVHAVKKNQVRVVDSIQGKWTPDMEWPQFSVEHHH